MSEAFVRQLYQNILFREPDAAGLQNWVNQISSGAMTPAQVTMAIAHSAEAKSVDFVVRMYLVAFDRMPDDAGLRNWVQAYKNGMSTASIAKAFAESAEFQMLRGSLSNEEFFNYLYREVLHRPPEPEGMAFWMATLEYGATRAQLMMSFSLSTEFTQTSSTRVEYTLAHQAVFGKLPTLAMADSVTSGTQGTTIVESLYKDAKYLGAPVPGLIPEPVPANESPRASWTPVGLSQAAMAS